MVVGYEARVGVGSNSRGWRGLDGCGEHRVGTEVKVNVVNLGMEIQG